MLVFRKRVREQEIEAEENAKKKKEWDKNWEVCLNSEPHSLHLKVHLTYAFKILLDKKLVFVGKTVM